MTQETGPSNLDTVINSLGKDQLRDLISWGQTRQADRGVEPPVPQLVTPPPPASESSPPAGQGLGGAVRNVLSGAREYLRPLPDQAPAKREAASEKGFVEEIDGLLASAEGPVKKITVTPPRLASYLQTLPLPQDARLQNLNIEILDGRSVRAQGKISKAGTSGFIVMLGADQDGGDLKVVSTGLTNVALTHRGQTGNITQHLGNLILTLQKQLDSQIADKTWKAAGFSISEDRERLVVNFENGEQKQAREEFQNTLANFKDLSTKNKPTLEDLAPALFGKGGKSWEAETPERKLAYPDFVRRTTAGRIEKGRIYPADPMVTELFDLLHEGEAEAIKAIIGQKLDEAGDQPWASAWREYLSPPAADGAEIAGQPLRVTDVGSAAELAPQEPVTPGRDELLARMIAMLKSTSLSGDAGTADAGPAPAAAEESTDGGLEPVAGADQPLEATMDENLAGEIQRVAGATDITPERLAELLQQYQAERRAGEEQ